MLRISFMAKKYLDLPIFALYLFCAWRKLGYKKITVGGRFTDMFVGAFQESKEDLKENACLNFNVTFNRSAHASDQIAEILSQLSSKGSLRNGHFTLASSYEEVRQMTPDFCEAIENVVIKIAKASYISQTTS